MEVDKLATVINSYLKKDTNASVNKICDKLGLKQSTVKTQLRNNGYKFDINARQYIKEVETVTIDNDKILELIEMIKPMRKIIKHYNENVESIEIKPYAIKEVRQKLFKVDVEVLAKWDTFRNNNRQFKVQQLISLAIDEFIEKYS